MNRELVVDAIDEADRNHIGTLEEHIEMLWARNLIATGELAEQAAANLGNLTQNPTNQQGSDYTDGTEHKYSEVHYDLSSAYATLASIKNKTGTIRLRVFEPKTEKEYFFLVPHDVYSQYSSLKAYFTQDGTPRKMDPRRSHRPDLWSCQEIKEDYINNTSTRISGVSGRKIVLTNAELLFGPGILNRKKFSVVIGRDKFGFDA